MRTNRVGGILVVAVLASLVLTPAIRAEESFADEVKALCKDFKSTYKKLADEEVAAAIDELMVKYKDEECDDKLKKLVVTTIGSATRLRSDEAAAHALKALGDTDANALRYLEGSLKSSLKAKPPKVDRYEACFESLGKIAHPKSVKTLTGYLKYKDYDVIAQAAEALQGYKDAKGKLRKEIFEELLKISEGLYSSAQANDSGEPARKWRVIKNSMMDGMNAVSRQELSDPRAARRWYNDNKKKNWDKLE